MQARTILSQNTTDTTSSRAFKKLKDSFPTWEEVRIAPAGQSLASRNLPEFKDHLTPELS